MCTVRVVYMIRNDSPPGPVRATEVRYSVLNQRSSALILPGRFAMAMNIPMHQIQAEKQPIGLQMWRCYGLEA